MPKLSVKSKLAIAVIALIAIVLIGGILFPVAKPEAHLAPNYDSPFAKLGPIYVSNTLISAWIGIVLLIIFFFFATRKMKLVPKGLQNIAEWIIETMLNFVEGVAGKENARRFFPVVGTIFLFVLMNAWLGLLPIFGVIGRGSVPAEVSDNLLHTLVPSLFPNYQGFEVTVPLLRPANTDINVPLMLALVSFVCVEYWGITSVGLRSYLSKFFRFGQVFAGLGQLIKGKVKSAIGVILFGAIDIFVGFLELLSEFVRILSFTFRLFGNMTAGEILLVVIAFLVPWGLASIFYGLETFLGVIQALIFSVLTLVFATMAITPHHGEEEHK
jgi:F-type H+-transporting ATPase subunit a